MLFRSGGGSLSGSAEVEAEAETDADAEVEADADGVAVAEGVLAPHPAKLPNNMNMTRAKLSILKTDFLMVLPPLKSLLFTLFRLGIG